MHVRVSTFRPAHLWRHAARCVHAPFRRCPGWAWRARAAPRCASTCARVCARVPRGRKLRAACVRLLHARVCTCARDRTHAQAHKRTHTRLDVEVALVVRLQQPLPAGQRVGGVGAIRRNVPACVRTCMCRVCVCRTLRGRVERHVPDGAWPGATQMIMRACVCACAACAVCRACGGPRAVRATHAHTRAHTHTHTHTHTHPVQSE